MIHLPLQIELNTKGLLVKSAALTRREYIENIVYTLQISFDCNNLATISYYGEDDSYLDEVQILWVLKNVDKLR